MWLSRVSDPGSLAGCSCAVGQACCHLKARSWEGSASQATHVVAGRSSGFSWQVTRDTSSGPHGHLLQGSKRL